MTVQPFANPALRRLVAYGIASAAALAVDMAAFLGLVACQLAVPTAASIGYAVGIAVHWFLSSRFVFTARVATDRKRLMVQRGMFVLTAVTGLGLTWAIVMVGTELGLVPLASKLVSIGVAFFATYLLRIWIVFPAVRDREVFTR